MISSHDDEFVRLMYYPAGIAYLREVLGRFASWRPPGSDSPDSSSTARTILESIDLMSGSSYVTVPFHYAEGTDLKNLAESQFYRETDESREKGEKYRADVDLAGGVDAAIFKMVARGRFALVFDRDSTVRPRGTGESPVMWTASTQRAFTAMDTEEVLVGACFNSLDELRYVVSIEEPDRAMQVRLNELVEFPAESIRVIACSIFDWSGYLLWFSRVPIPDNR